MAIKRTEDGIWRVDIQPGGRKGRRVRKTFQTKSEALAWEQWAISQHKPEHPWNAGAAKQRLSASTAEAVRLMTYGDTEEFKRRIKELPHLAGKGAYVYVMRCPAHVRDLYKIGFTNTTPEIRAHELSRVTASPIRFEVVEAWVVTDAKAAEERVFTALCNRRANKSREFFFGRYADIRLAIVEAINQWVA